MDNRIKTYNRFLVLTVFFALPLMVYFLGDFPRRSILKETISVLTILAFFVMIMQFYFSRANKPIIKGHSMSKIVKWHKALGYIFVSVLLIHPLLIVLPRYFEAGITPQDALLEIISNLGQQGLIFGITAWVLMLTIGLTSLFRNKLPITYRTWRSIHGYLAIAFISIASFHVITVGRHIDKPMTWLIFILTFSGIVMLLKIYFLKPAPKKRISL